ncbi:unnamed protein product [Trichogramma brassicae]|uniref:Uncharacterized protein n=1 Tax=Trichogramma brassicae TaxID=86971 RepID=A0A6H5IA12_9HYME|nr:unnamed protein product [Trichogramma brassicae]
MIGTTITHSDRDETLDLVAYAVDRSKSFCRRQDVCSQAHTRTRAHSATRRAGFTSQRENSGGECADGTTLDTESMSGLILIKPLLTLPSGSV